MRSTSAGRELPAIAALASLGTTAVVLPVFLLGGMSATMRPELGFDERALGIMVGLYFGSAAVSSALLGGAVGRLGARRSATLALAATAFASLGMATLATTPGRIVPLLMLAGVGNGMIQPAANLAIARRIPRPRQGITFGIKQAAIPLATLLSGLALPVIALTVGWRWAYAGVALLAPAVALGTVRFFPDRDDDLAARPVVRAAKVPRWRVRARGGRGPSPLRGSRGRLGVLAVAGALGSGAANALGAFLVASAVDAGVAAAAAGLLLSLGSAGAVIARLVVGWVADRTRIALSHVIAGMMAAGGIAFILIPELLMTPGGPVVVLVAFIGCLGWAGIYQLSIVRQHPVAAAAATGFTQAGMFTGGLLGPIAFGSLAAGLGYAAAWRAAGGAAVVAAMLVIGQMMAGRTTGRRSVALG